MKRRWWKEAVVYQIYPRSFADSNGDGIGDLRGIIGKLDYLQELGVDIIWLNPVYKSPNDDCGYDISDYQDINPDFGTMADFEELLDQAHRRDMRLVMDLVVNHTSDEHPWFVESRSAKENPKRDYYIWRPAKNGKEPNNWRSFFAGSAWEFDPQTGEYYLHLFSRKMPDLNWAKPEVKREIFAMMKWWLDKGIDGFRMDVINLLVKPQGFPDAADPTDIGFYCNQPGIHEILHEMNREVLSQYDVFTVGELPCVTPEIARLYVDEDRQELNMLFHFEHFEAMDKNGWDLVEFKRIQRRWYEALKKKGWNTQFLNNHDGPRMVSRFGDDSRYRVASAKLLATMTHTLPGTPFIYQGEEIGMTNVAFPSIAHHRDIWTVSRFQELVQKGADPKKTLRSLQRYSRDNARTPFQWDDSPNAGFTTGTPWILVNPNYREINLARDLQSKDSIFCYYQRLIRLRKETPTLVYGEYCPFLEDDPSLYVYERALDDDRILIVLNLSGEAQELALPQEVAEARRELLLANLEGAEEAGLTLRPWEARVYRYC